MDTTTLCAFLGEVEPTRREKLLSYLPQDQRETLLKPSHGMPKPTPFADVLALIHPDWLQPYLCSYSETDQLLILSVLGKKVSDHFTVDEPLPSLPPLAKRYLQNVVRSWLTVDGKELTPLSCLPEHPLLHLLNCNCSALKKRISFWGLHDLSTELKKVIQKKLLKQLDNLLSIDEKRYLKLRVSESEPISFAKLNLSSWDGQESTLREILFHRGLNRFAKALFGVDETFLYFITHKLTPEGAELFSKLYVNPKNPELQETLIKQINAIHTFLSGDTDEAIFPH